MELPSHVRALETSAHVLVALRLEYDRDPDAAIHMLIDSIEDDRARLLAWTMSAGAAARKAPNLRLLH
jgi:hypothetical protein